MNPSSCYSAACFVFFPPDSALTFPVRGASRYDAVRCVQLWRIHVSCGQVGWGLLSLGGVRLTEPPRVSLTGGDARRGENLPTSTLDERKSVIGSIALWSEHNNLNNN